MIKKLGILLAVVACGFIFNTSEVKASTEIIVNKTTQQLVCWDNETAQIYLFCPCSTAIDPNGTPVGTFKATDIYTNWHSLYYNQWTYGAIRLGKSHILIHSTPYLSPDFNTLDLVELQKLGIPASHGCIRVAPENIVLLTQLVQKGALITVVQ